MSGDRLRRQYRFTTLPEHLIRDKNITDRAVRLWCLLDRYAGANGEAFPTRHTLADDLGCSRASVDRALSELVSGGWLAKERREAGGSNDYTLLIAKAPTTTKRKPKTQAKGRGGLTSDDTPHDSPVSAGGGLTGDDTLDSQATQPVITGDAHKEASPRKHQVNESSDDSLRSSSAGADGTSGTRAIGDADEVTAKRRASDAERITRAYHAWYEREHDAPIYDRKRDHFACLGLVKTALEHYSEDEIKRALFALKRPVPNKREWQDALVAIRNGRPVASGSRPQPRNVHHSGDQAQRDKITQAFGGR